MADYTIYDVKTYPYDKLLECRTVSTAEQGNSKDPATYIDLICAFDIETTNIPKIEQAVMYSFAIAMGTQEVITGRKWEEYKYFCAQICDTMLRYQRIHNTPQTPRICLYVHNLSFEFEFLQGIYPFTPDEVFAVDKRKILRAWAFDKKIEYRCSYLWSNMGLATLTAKYHVKHQKLDGIEFDYSKQRFWYSELTDKEWEYQINDVLGLVESIEKAMQLDGDTLVSIPKTSTGYVRRDMRQACQPIYGKLKWLLPRSLDLYKILRASFRGGNTHANRYVVADYNSESELHIMHKIYSADMSSCYPAVILTEKYPMTPFDEIISPNEMIMRRLLRKDALVMHVTFEGIRLSDEMYPVPYISHDRCQDIPIYDQTYNGRPCKIEGCKLDNGRVLKADKLSIAINDIDFKIIEQQYTWDKITINKLYRSHYGYLPTEIRSLVRDYYARKTILKGEDDELTKVLYEKIKNQFNAIYGMFAQDCVKEDIIFDIAADLTKGQQRFTTKSERELADWDRLHPAPDGLDAEYESERMSAFFGIRNAIFEGLLDKYVRETGWLPYQIGCWVTAHSRARLEAGIRYVFDHTDYLKHIYFVYCDTDSIKYADRDGTPDDPCVIDWETFNRETYEKSVKHGGQAPDKNGKLHTLGIYETERTADRFLTMGAKKYAAEYDTDNGTELKITIAGVGKKAGAEYLQYKAKYSRSKKIKSGIDLLKQDHFVFPAYYDNKDWIYYKDGKKIKGMRRPAGGGTLAKYNDDVDMYMEIDGHAVHITPNVYIGDSEKTVSREKLTYLDLTILSAQNIKAWVENAEKTLDKDILT